MSASILAFSLGMMMMLPICIGLYFIGRSNGFDDGQIALIARLENILKAVGK